MASACLGHMMSETFIDLRSRGEGSQEHTSFWPSFTDIMMVIVMIFTLASVVLIIRNWDLVRNLRETIEAEQQAKELVRSASEANATLEEQLVQAQYRISELRIQLMKAGEAQKLQNQILDERDRQIISLDNALEQSRDALQKSTTQLSRLEEALTQNQAILAQQEENLAQQEEHSRRSIWHS